MQLPSARGTSRAGTCPRSASLPARLAAPRAFRVHGSQPLTDNERRFEGERVHGAEEDPCRRSSALASARSSSRSTSPIPTPRCTRSAGAIATELDECGDRFGIETRYTDYEELLKDPNVDAVHINSPIADHAPQSIAALEAGKHVASTVPAATTIDECRQIVEAQRKSGKVYMMMETVVYSREYLFVKELYDKGELGRIQFLRGSHQQDMDGWPGYWEGFPPMHYATHCVSPCLALLGKHAEHVVCHGSGRIGEASDPEVRQPVRDRDRDVQAARLGRRAPRSRAACSTPPGSTARASTPTARRSRSSGSRWRTRSR